MANTNTLLEMVCDIIMTVFAVLTGLMMMMFMLDIGGAAWGSNEETPEFWHASTWSEDCMCACDWTTGSFVTEEGQKGKTAMLAECSESDTEVLMGCMYRLRKQECEDDGQVEPAVAWDCDNPLALLGPSNGLPWNDDSSCQGPGSCQKWVDVMSREWDDSGPFDGAPGDPPQSGHADFSEACANSGWFTFIHSGSALFNLVTIPTRVAYVLLIWGLGGCINLPKKDRKITLILLITDTCVCMIWYHIIFGQVLFRMVGFPTLIYPRGPSTISINLAIPTWIGWFQWGYGWIRDEEEASSTTELTVKDEESDT